MEKLCKRGNPTCFIWTIFKSWISLEQLPSYTKRGIETKCRSQSWQTNASKDRNAHCLIRQGNCVMSAITRQESATFADNYLITHQSATVRIRTGHTDKNKHPKTLIFFSLISARNFKVFPYLVSLNLFLMWGIVNFFLEIVAIL